MRTKETKYKNIVFRSRLEARWAVFFDALNIRWKYEPEGYVLNDGTSYLPDFYLENVGGHIGKNNGEGIFVEIKGNLTDYDKKKINGFEYPIVVLGDIPDSTAVWREIYKTHAEDETVWFSEYTIDRYMGPIWFAECGSGMKLLRRNECTAKGFISWCEKGCEKARNYKFEFAQQSTESTSGYSKNSNNNYHKINDFYSRGMSGMYQSNSSNVQKMQEQKRLEEEAKKKINEELKSLDKISVQKVKDILISQPGIIEYGLDKRLKICALDKEIPVNSSLSVSRDFQNKRLIISYEYRLKSSDYFVAKLRGNILYIDLSVSSESTIHSENNEYNQMKEIIARVYDLWTEEIGYEGTAKAGYEQFLDKKNRRIKIFQEELQKAKIKEQQRIENEKMEIEEKERFFEINNRLSIGEFITCLKSELLKEKDSKFLKEFTSLRLMEGIDFDTKFGLGKFVFKQYADEIILSINHNFSMMGTKHTHHHFDTRNLMSLDCMFDDLLDNKAMRQKKNDLINAIEEPLRRVEGMFLIKQQKMDKGVL